MITLLGSGLGQFWIVSAFAQVCVYRLFVSLHVLHIIDHLILFSKSVLLCQGSVKNVLMSSSSSFSGSGQFRRLHVRLHSEKYLWDGIGEDSVSYDSLIEGFIETTLWLQPDVTLRHPLQFYALLLALAYAGTHPEPSWAMLCVR